MNNSAMLLRQSFYSIICLGHECPSVRKRMFKNVCHKSLFHVLFAEKRGFQSCTYGVPMLH